MQLTELLDELDIDYKMPGEHHHCVSGWLQIDCCHCSPGTGRFRLGISLRWWNANCWACGTISLTEALAGLSGRSSQQIKELLPKRGEKWDSSDSSNRVRASGKLTLPSGTGPLQPRHEAYLRQRGLNPEELVKLWGLQGTGLCSSHPWRIVIPVSLNGKVVSWTTRSLGDKGQRYIHASPDHELIPIKDTVLGWDYVRHSVIITEGPFDAMRVGPGAVCTFGVGLASVQIALLAKVPQRVVLMDRDTAGVAGASKLVSELSVFPGETIRITLESGKDPASADEQEIREIRKRFLEQT